MKRELREKVAKLDDEKRRTFWQQMEAAAEKLLNGEPEDDDFETWWQKQTGEKPDKPKAEDKPADSKE